MNSLQARAQTHKFQQEREKRQLPMILKSIEDQSSIGEHVTMIGDVYESTKRALFALGYTIHTDDKNISYISW